MTSEVHGAEVCTLCTNVPLTERPPHSREVSIQNRRQFVITTCNDEFYRLALSKLSCLNMRDVTQFRAYRLEGLRQEGPEIIIDAPYWENEEVKAAEPH